MKAVPFARGRRARSILFALVLLLPAFAGCAAPDDAPAATVDPTPVASTPSTPAPDAAGDVPLDVWVPALSASGESLEMLVRSLTTDRLSGEATYELVADGETWDAGAFDLDIGPDEIFGFPLSLDGDAHVVSEFVLTVRFDGSEIVRTFTADEGAAPRAGGEMPDWETATEGDSGQHDGGHGDDADGPSVMTADGRVVAMPVDMGHRGPFDVVAYPYAGGPADAPLFARIVHRGTETYEGALRLDAVQEDMQMNEPGRVPIKNLGIVRVEPGEILQVETTFGASGEGGFGWLELTGDGVHARGQFFVGNEHLYEAPPSGEHEWTFPTFKLVFDTSGEQGVPLDYASRVADAYNQSYAFFRDTWGLPEPLGPVWVQIKYPGGGAGGTFSPREFGDHVVIGRDSDLPDDGPAGGGRVENVVAHEVFHAFQFRFDPDEDFILEGLATWAMAAPFQDSAEPALREGGLGIAQAFIAEPEAKPITYLEHEMGAFFVHLAAKYGAAPAVSMMHRSFDYDGAHLFEAVYGTPFDALWKDFAVAIAKEDLPHADLLLHDGASRPGVTWRWMGTQAERVSARIAAETLEATTATAGQTIALDAKGYTTKAGHVHYPHALHFVRVLPGASGDARLTFEGDAQTDWTVFLVRADGTIVDVTPGTPIRVDGLQAGTPVVLGLFRGESGTGRYDVVLEPEGALSPSSTVAAPPSANRVGPLKVSLLPSDMGAPDDAAFVRIRNLGDTAFSGTVSLYAVSQSGARQLVTTVPALALTPNAMHQITTTFGALGDGMGSFVLEGDGVRTSVTATSDEGLEGYNDKAPERQHTWTLDQYTITFDTTGGQSVSLDYVRRVTDALNASWTFYRDAWGLPEPFGPVHVEIADPEDPSVVGTYGHDDYGDAIVVGTHRRVEDQPYSPGDDLVENVAAHELFHAFQYRYDSREDLVMEGIATWAMGAPFADAADARLAHGGLGSASHYLQDTAEKPLQYLSHNLGAFFLHLQDAYGHEPLVRMLPLSDEYDARGLFDVAFAEHGKTFDDLWRGFVEALAAKRLPYADVVYAPDSTAEDPGVLWRWTGDDERLGDVVNRRALEYATAEVDTTSPLELSEYEGRALDIDHPYGVHLIHVLPTQDGAYTLTFEPRDDATAWTVFLLERGSGRMLDVTPGEPLQVDDVEAGQSFVLAITRGDAGTGVYDVRLGGA